MAQSESSDDGVSNSAKYIYMGRVMKKIFLKICRPGPTQTGQYSLPQKIARGLKFGFRNESGSTIYVAKTKV